jgi:integrase
LPLGQDRERHVLRHGRPRPNKEVPTLEEFAARFLDGYARANRLKPSGIAAKVTILRVHLVPVLGPMRLDAITNETVQRLKHGLAGRAPKTVNNVLTVLNVLLKKAAEWDVVERMPCTIRLLPIPKGEAAFYDFDEYERLIVAAAGDDRNAHLIALLGGEAGLRCGEMMALEWSDVDFHKRQLRVQRSDWKGHVTATKGGRVRYVPLTIRLAAALQGHRHLRGLRVLSQQGGSPLTQKIVQDYARRAARRANVKPGVHILLHTFCSHLAMRGAPARAIQEVAGHQDLSTTQRYMHLSPAAVESAIRLLDAAGIGVQRGNMLATCSTEIGKSTR